MQILINCKGGVYISIIFYKQRFRHPNYKKTPLMNYDQIRYIAKRAGVMYNEEMTHGLFGKLSPGDMEEFNSWEEVARKVRELSYEKVNIYRGIISFNRDTANELGLHTKKDWQIYVETHINTLATINDIKIQNLGFACAVHNERGHPHVHINFWDKSQEVMKNYISKQIPNEIRKQLIKDTFEDRIKEFYEQKGQALNEIREETETIIKEFEQYRKDIYPMEQEEYKKQFETFDEDSIISNISFTKFNSDEIKDIADRLFKLKNMLPKSGRLVYQFLCEDVKKEIDIFVKDIINNNEGLRRAIKLYVESKMNITKLYSSNEEYLKDKGNQYTKEAEKLVANKVLSFIKVLIKKEKEFGKLEFNNHQKQYYAKQLIMDLLEMLGCKAISNDRRFRDSKGMITSTELSKDARKEIYLRNLDKGVER